MNISSADDLSNLFLGDAITVLQSNKDLADRAVVQVPDDKLHTPISSDTNSIAVIMKHVAGNLLSRWTDFLTSDGEKPWRNRDDEFVDSFTNRAELLAYWERGWACLFDTLKSLTPGDFSKVVTIRDEPHSVSLAIQRSSTHCAYHVGQIVLLARALVEEGWQTLTIPKGESEAYNKKFREKWKEKRDTSR